jgi:hypothetical protein
MGKEPKESNKNLTTGWNINPDPNIYDGCQNIPRTPTSD